MIHQFTSIYTPAARKLPLAQLKITCRLDCCWLLCTSTLKKINILCILYWTGAKQRLKCCYTAVVFCLYKVSPVDWIRNFINFELSKFGYYLVHFIEFKIPNYFASRYVHTRWDNHLNWLVWMLFRYWTYL